MTRKLDPPGLVIFDCDGTLVDSSISNRLFYDGIKTGLGLAPLTPEEEAYSYVQTVDRTLRRIIPEDLLDRAFEAVAAADWKDLVGAVRLQPGVLDFIRSLKRAGMLTAVNTNSGEEVRTVLDRLNVKLKFELIVSADDVTRPKPDPEGVLFILDKLEVEQNRTIYIGDSLIDQLTAQGAGVTFWAYGNPELEADLHFDDYAELEHTLQFGDNPGRS